MAAKKKKKKSAPKKKKPAPKKKKASAAPKAKPAAAGWTEFPPVLVTLTEWVNEGRAGSIDFEMYGAFNEQYKPSDWTRNPKTDEELFTFGMDGTGGQVAIWRNDNAKAFDALPIVFLGSEGEVKPLAMSLPKFLHLLASGIGPLEASDSAEPNENPEMMEWVRAEYPNAKSFGAPSDILEEAASELGHFEKHLMSQVPAD